MFSVEFGLVFKSCRPKIDPVFLEELSWFKGAWRAILFSEGVGKFWPEILNAEVAPKRGFDFMSPNSEFWEALIVFFVYSLGWGLRPNNEYLPDIWVCSLGFYGLGGWFFVSPSFLYMLIIYF